MTPEKFVFCASTLVELAFSRLVVRATVPTSASWVRVPSMDVVGGVTEEYDPWLAALKGNMPIVLILQHLSSRLLSPRLARRSAIRRFAASGTHLRSPGNGT